MPSNAGREVSELWAGARALAQYFAALEGGFRLSMRKPSKHSLPVLSRTFSRNGKLLPQCQATSSPRARRRESTRIGPATGVSIALAAIATLCLFPVRHSLELTLSLAPFPRTSCDSASRRVVPPDCHLAKFRATQRWRCCTAVLSASALPPLRGLGLLGAYSRVLCIAAGAGHAVHAFRSTGVREVAGVDLVEFPPLVRCGDPHHLLFSAGAFDLLFSDDPRAISGALFPICLAAEAERVVCRGGGRPARRSGSSETGAGFAAPQVVPFLGFFYCKE
ncbi:uncharacterized protein LOC112873187 [Panicum hallii]|uniref:uncharacterized protein LOC112873187 n=1 Tax=Panicum hallii TaxID=206008 RepID=UPI000DF4CF56|nr:uncharacterized protein LOC112873187 [Panicum hallii]